jgi:Mlc titration factor MtfA (ptsG expression regulator)
LQAEAGESTYINHYAATSPAEFYAVLSEYFFTAPDILKKSYPDVYEQLTLFYQQPIM